MQNKPCASSAVRLRNALLAHAKLRVVAALNDDDEVEGKKSGVISGVGLQRPDDALSCCVKQIDMLAVRPKICMSSMSM